LNEAAVVERLRRDQPVAYGHERVRLSRGAKDVAYLVSVEEAHLLELLEDSFDLHDALVAVKPKSTSASARRI
jgi:hypothetical protein